MRALDFCVLDENTLSQNTKLQHQKKTPPLTLLTRVPIFRYFLLFCISANHKGILSLSEVDILYNH